MQLKKMILFISNMVALCFCSVEMKVNAQPATPTDIGWPRQITKNGTELVYYQPQIDEWKDHKELAGRFAFSLTPKNGKQFFGVASVKCGTLVDKDEHTVYIRDVVYEDVRFPSLSNDSVKIMTKAFKALAPVGGDPVSIERIIADLDQSKTTAQTVQLKNDPPPVFYSSTPSILLIVEGDPVMAPVDKTNIEFVVNTNWDLFFDKQQKDYYLLVNTIWFTTKDLKGTWVPTQHLPKDMSKFPTGQNFDEVKKSIPPPAVKATVPKIFFSDKPAELVQLKGAPVYSKITGTQLSYISNTDNDLFRDNADKQFYLLLSGRWFRSATLEGPWSYAGNDLPKDFSKIPGNSPKSNVLVSVPGTIEASDAVMLAQVPTTAIVNKAAAEKQVKVTYEGQPQFKPIENTSLQYATNTPDKVIKVGDLYYLCFQAVWFMSTTPNGPWKTAVSVPAEIYTIPPTSPVYNVTYVTQTNETETTVESSSSGGYLGMFILGVGIGACIAYGTGYYYPPYVWWGPGMLYPVYRPWPCAWGAGVVYNPWTGGWAAGRAVYGPYGAARSAAWYNPATGRYGRAATVQGWYGGRTAAAAYNPWTGGYAATSQAHNAYAQWGTSVASRGNQWVQTGHVTTAGGTAFGYRASTGNSGIVGPNGAVIKGNNGTYAGHDGNVYKKDDNGNWSKYNNNTKHWDQKIGGDGGTRKTLDNADRFRQRGQTQIQRFQNNRGRFGGNLGGARVGGFRHR
jgi:hypothetical protein